MHNTLKYTLTILMVIALITIGAATEIESNKDTLLRCGDDRGDSMGCDGNNFVVGVHNVVDTPATFDLYLTGPDPLPKLDKSGSLAENIVELSPDHIRFNSSNQGMGYLKFTTDYGIPAGTYTVRIMDSTGQSYTKDIIITVPPTPTPTPTPTPEPTPEPTTEVTTIPTTEPTIEPTLEPTTQAIQEMIVTPAPTPTPTDTVTEIQTTQTEITPMPTATVNYSATIAVLEERLDQQEEKIGVLESILASIRQFLGME